MSSILASSKPKLKNGCRLEEGGEALLIPEGMIRLKGTGFKIVQFCNGEKTVAEIVQTLQTEFQRANPEEIEKDVSSFLDRLYEKGLLQLL